MSNETNLTIRGRLASDPELRFTPSGAAVANITIVANARKFDKQRNEWVDQTATFWRCSIWRDAAENVAESLQKGMAVVAFGEVKSREYETKEGEKRTVIEVELEAIGPDLRWQTAKVAKAQRQGGGFGGQQPAQGQQDDPWAVGPSKPTYDEPPF